MTELIIGSVTLDKAVRMVVRTPRMSERRDINPFKRPTARLATPPITSTTEFKVSPAAPPPKLMIPPSMASIVSDKVPVTGSKTPPVAWFTALKAALRRPPRTVWSNCRMLRTAPTIAAMNCTTPNATPIPPLITALATGTTRLITSGPSPETRSVTEPRPSA